MSNIQPRQVVGNSLGFNAGANTSLSRAFTSFTDTKKTTISFWMKGLPPTGATFFSWPSGPYDYIYFSLNYNGSFNFYTAVSAAFPWRLSTTQVIRDPSAWYHIVFVWDTHNATASNRLLLYINGVQVTSFTTATYPSQDYVGYMNQASTYYFGYWPGYGYGLDISLSEITWVDGQALDPSSFGYFDSITNKWSPKQYRGAFGNNGFYLPFSDGTSTTTLGQDKSGGFNHWTLNNFTRAAGVSDCWVTDSPTNNYPILDNTFINASSLATAGGLAFNTSPSNSYSIAAATQLLPLTGQWYWEVPILSAGGTADPLIGIMDPTYSPAPMNRSGSGAANSLGYAANEYAYSANGNKVNNNSSTAYGSSFTVTDVTAVAYDADNRAVYFAKQTSGTGAFVWQNGGDPTSGASKTGAAFTVNAGVQYVAAVCIGNAPSQSSVAVNFGQRSLNNTAIPLGYKTLRLANIPRLGLRRPERWMDVVTYTGNSSGQNIASKVDYPDFVWIKSRASSTSHKLTDSVRGVTKALSTDTAGVEATDTNGLNTFTATGFTLGSDSNYNNNGDSYVAWVWKAGGAAVAGSGTGSITNVSYSANRDSGFSTVLFTGGGSIGTVTHGCSVYGVPTAPSLIITKQRTTGTNNDWFVYHSSVGAGYKLLLNTLAQASSSTAWNSTSPTSTVFTVNDQAVETGKQFVAYCWAEVPGFSKFGSYVANNGSTDGPRIYCGFKPRYVLITCMNGAAPVNWVIVDSTRSSFNPTLNNLNSNNNATEATTQQAEYIDFLSNGFKIRSVLTDLNYVNYTHIYAAFAEFPVIDSTAR